MLKFHHLESYSNPHQSPTELKSFNHPHCHFVKKQLDVMLCGVALRRKQDTWLVAFTDFCW